MTSEVIPCIFYFYFYFKLKEKSVNGLVTIKNAKSYLHHWKIPKNIRPIIIKELELLGLVEKVDRWMLKLNREGIDFNNTNEIYELAGLLPHDN